MAATFCNLSPGYGFNKPNEYHLTRRIFKRSYVCSNSSSCCNAQNFLHKTYRRPSKAKQWNHSPRSIVNNQADHLKTVHEENKEEDISQVTLIWRAIKLPIYSVALVPLTEQIRTKKNQLSTFLEGTLVAAYSLLALGFMLLTWTSIQAGSKRAILLLTCAITCGYIYQCPPFRLSYQGLGEPLCFAAFGPFATSAFYLLQGTTSDVSHPLILLSSVLVGFTTSLILFCSHFHQIEGDKAVGKMSPLVRIGTERGAKVVKLTIITLYVFTFALGLSRVLPFTCILLCALTLPLAKLVVRFVEENHKDNQKIFMAKYYCVRLHTLFGAALAAGLVFARMLPKRYIPFPPIIFS